MTITFNGETLCAGDSAVAEGDPVGPDGLRIHVVPGTEEYEYLGAEGIAAEHVGCDTAGVSFRVARMYASIPAARSAAFSLKASTPRQGVLSVDGSALIAKAVLRDMDIRNIGCTLVINYTIEGF